MSKVVPITRKPRVVADPEQRIDTLQALANTPFKEEDEAWRVLSAFRRIWVESHRDDCAGLLQVEQAAYQWLASLRDLHTKEPA